MNKRQRDLIGNLLTELKCLNENVSQQLKEGKTPKILEDIGKCQEWAIVIGERVERIQGEDCAIVSYLEDYCEEIYKLNELVLTEKSEYYADKLYELSKLLEQIEHVLYHNTELKYEIVLMPYKISMWDSLESIYYAAKEDPACDVYVVPIPYFDRNSDMTFGQGHYEGGLFPKEITIMDYEEYILEERVPDIIYIHNPYDANNSVTSVAPQYYSHELKKYTDCLVYVPYYVTTGGMAEMQEMLPAYKHADYIIMQAKGYEDFIDKSVSREKLLPMGSPKFDKILKLCKEKSDITTEWKDIVQGKKVYFYNTSINGMLADTKAFLYKMEYVFQCFQGREDVILLWRPHPLLETTFLAKRPDFYPFYMEMKQLYIKNKIGIFDETPEIESTIALCDAYLGDDATSVTALFGVAGKPIFILNNLIHTLPKKDDWRGEIITSISSTRDCEWMVLKGKYLFRAAQKNYRYEYVMELSEKQQSYCNAFEYEGKVYVCPNHAQNILVISNNQIERKIELDYNPCNGAAFYSGYLLEEGYIFLYPNQYPAIVRYDIRRDKIDYLEGYKDVFVQKVNGIWRYGGWTKWNQYVVFPSPLDNRVLAVHIDTMQVQMLQLNIDNYEGCRGMVPDGDYIWSLPYCGTRIARWNPLSGEVKIVGDVPPGFEGKNRSFGYKTFERLFGSVALEENYVIVSPDWGNQFLKIDKNTLQVSKWDVPIDLQMKENNGYYSEDSVGGFLFNLDEPVKEKQQFFYYPERMLFEVNIETCEFTEIPIEIDCEQLRELEPGFCEESQWVRYACRENAFNSLVDFLDGNITGASFDCSKQLRAYGRIVANMDGTCGEKIHLCMMEKLGSIET